MARQPLTQESDLGAILLGILLLVTFGWIMYNVGYHVAAGEFADGIECNFILCTYTENVAELTATTTATEISSVETISRTCLLNGIPINCSEMPK
jgi:ammonia channel protein AmtB